MIRTYVPSTHLSGSWSLFSSTARAQNDWDILSPGTPVNMADVCSADYRSDKNFSSVTGLMGEKLCYSVVPFVIRNEFASPHTYMYDVGFSSVVQNPSGRSTGLNSNGTPAESTPAQNFSSETKHDMNFSSGKFKSFSDRAFGFNILGSAGSGSATVWDLQNNYCWNDESFCFSVSSNKMSVSPEVLAKAVGYCHNTGKSQTSIAISKDNPELGNYNPYIWDDSAMRRAGVFQYSQINGGTIILERGAMLWGFFYFIVVDGAKIITSIADAHKAYQTNLVLSGSTSDLNYGYPAYPSYFSVAEHGGWNQYDLAQTISPQVVRSMWYGSVAARKVNAGFFVAGRKVD